MGFLIGRYRELLECRKVTSQKFCAVFVIPAILSRGYVVIGWRRLHEKNNVPLFVSRRWGCSLGVQDRVGTIRWIRRHIFVCIVQRRLVVSGYRSWHSDRCPKRIPDHRHQQRILAHRHQNWNYQHRSHVIFAGELRVSLYWTHQQISDQCGWFQSGAYVPTCGGVDDDQVLVWGICLEPYLAAIKRLWTLQRERNSVRFVWSAPSGCRTLREPSTPTLHSTTPHPQIQTRALPSFDMIVANRCPRSPWVRLLVSRTRRRTLRWRLVTLQ